jgi:colanic acid biosynthesis glycosyl transferase WcaI
MRIIAINRFYRPDHSASSQILGDLAEHLATSGHAVTVITSRLRYEGGDLLLKRETIAGVDIRRVATTRFGRSNLLGRAVDYISFYLSSFLSILATGRRDDVLIIKTDPPLITIPATLAARLKGMHTINWCQDLFPEVAASLGIGWAGGRFGRALRSLRNRSLRRASFNAVIHEKMAELLTSGGQSAGRLEVLPNWADPDIQPQPLSHNALREAWGLQGRFVVGYSGNLGRAHMPETVAALIKATGHIEGLTWLFIGGGAGLDAVRRVANEAGNVVFQPYQPRERLGESLSVPDVHLVSLDPKCEGSIVPSKVYGVRAVDRPVLFLGDADGAIARDLLRHRAGWVLNPYEPASWEPQVRALMNNGRDARAISPSWQAGWSAGAALNAWEDAITAEATTSPFTSTIDKAPTTAR